jgi:hypothetical protein
MSVAEKSGLQIPDWVPDHIAAKALELRQTHADSAIAVDLIERLTNDTRMKRVWSELAKQDRKAKGPRYRVDTPFASRGIDERNAAAGLLEQAFNIGRLTLMLPSPDRPMRPFVRLAQRLRSEAEGLDGDYASRMIAAHLQRLAGVCEGITGAAHEPAKAIATEIAHWLRTVFGKRMYGITARITSVIAGQEISERKVRTWMAAPFR